MPRHTLLIAAASVTLATPALAADAAPTSSLMARAIETTRPADPAATEPHALRDASLFAIAPEQPRAFQPHDLVQIIVRESKRAKSKHELETNKTYDLDGSISAWPDFNLEELLQLRLFAGRTTNLPEVRVGFEKDFQGEGDYKREDDFTARLTAEVLEVLPNGNLILEARTQIQTDDEVSLLKVTGVCRPADVTAANTVLSTQIHDLKVENVSEGELKKSNEKGIIAKILDTVFAF